VASLNHIGIAVSDIDSMKRLFALLGFGITHSEPVPEQGVVTHFLPVSRSGDLPCFEFLEVTDPAGAVAQFLKKRGPGIHHLSFSFQKGELDDLTQRLRDAGYRLIYSEAKPGAHSMRINFIHPASAGGLLIEIMEPASEPVK